VTREASGVREAGADVSGGAAIRELLLENKGRGTAGRWTNDWLMGGKNVFVSRWRQVKVDFGLNGAGEFGGPRGTGKAA